MTDAIDVVFYQGGDVEVRDFKLGEDLLWFFLSQLNYRNQTIVLITNRSRLWHHRYIDGLVLLT